MTSFSFLMLLDALKSLWWLGWALAIMGWMAFFVLNKVATETLNLYRSQEKEYEKQNSALYDLYKDSQRLNLDLLKVHEPDQYEITLKGLSEIYTKHLLNKNSKP